MPSTAVMRMPGGVGAVVKALGEKRERPPEGADPDVPHRVYVEGEAVGVVPDEAVFAAKLRAPVAVFEEADALVGGGPERALVIDGESIDLIGAEAVLAGEGPQVERAAGGGGSGQGAGRRCRGHRGRRTRGRCGRGLARRGRRSGDPGAR